LTRQKCFYFEEHWFKLCKAKREKMMKKFDLQKFLGERVRVGILVEYDSNRKLWSTYTPRTFWAIQWIN